MPTKKKPTKRSGKNASKKGAARKRAAPAASLTTALAQAAWAEADDALAEALVELDELEHATTEAARDAALAMLAQALARAARKRGLSRIGALGAREPFDSAKHDLSGMGKPPKTICVTARGVARGADTLRRSRVSAPARKGKR